MRTRTAPIRQITIKHYPGDLVVTSSASFVSALRAESAVAPLLLLSPANPLTLGFPGAPKLGGTSLYTREALVLRKIADRTVHRKVYRSALFISSTNCDL